MTLAGELLQSIQHLGSPDIDRDLLVLALGVAHSGHAVLLGAGLHLLPVANEVDDLSVSHSACQVARPFFGGVRLLWFLQKHRQCKV